MNQESPLCSPVYQKGQITTGWFWQAAFVGKVIARRGTVALRGVIKHCPYRGGRFGMIAVGSQYSLERQRQDDLGYVRKSVGIQRLPPALRATSLKEGGYPTALENLSAAVRKSVGIHPLPPALRATSLKEGGYPTALENLSGFTPSLRPFGSPPSKREAFLHV